MRLLRNIRYHDDRYAHFIRASRISNFLLITAGSAGFATAVNGHAWIAGASGALVALIGAGQIVYDWSSKAFAELALRNKFTLMFARAHQADVDIGSLAAEMTGAYADEGEVYYAVNALAYNAAQKAFDRPDSTLMTVATWRTWLRHVFRFDPRNFPDVSPSQR